MTGVESRPSEKFEFVFGDLAQTVPDITAIVLVSTDGIPRSRWGLSDESAATFGAAVSGFYSLAHSAGDSAGGIGAIRQFVVEAEHGQLYCVAAGPNSLLGVRAKQGADSAVVGHAIAGLVEALKKHLGTALRSTQAGPTSDTHAGA